MVNSRTRGKNRRKSPSVIRRVVVIRFKNRQIKCMTILEDDISGCVLFPAGSVKLHPFNIENKYKKYLLLMYSFNVEDYFDLWYKIWMYMRLPQLGNSVHGYFTHLRIVHQTDGPAWMNHLTNCPLYHFATVTFRHQLASATQRIHHQWSDH